MGGVRNTLGDLNNHLFEQLERLNEPGLKGDELQEEITRAKAVTSLASQIISNSNLALKVKTFMVEYPDAITAGSGKDEKGDKKKIPAMLKADFLRE